MYGIMFHSSDVVSTSLEVAVIASLVLGILTLISLSWTVRQWKLTVSLYGVALLASSFHYMEMAQIWLFTQQLTGAHRYVGWFVVHPLQVMAIFFFARNTGDIPVGIFWRMLIAVLLMVLGRYLGDATYFNPTLGVLISIAFWLYILGEMYFGRMADSIHKSSRPIRRGYFWIRLIMTIGWAIYPILHFVDVVIGAGHNGAVVVLYTLADLVNLMTVSMIILAVAGKES